MVKSFCLGEGMCPPKYEYTGKIGEGGHALFVPFTDRECVHLCTVEMSTRPNFTAGRGSQTFLFDPALPGINVLQNFCNR